MKYNDWFIYNINMLENNNTITIQKQIKLVK